MDHQDGASPRPVRHCKRPLTRSRRAPHLLPRQSSATEFRRAKTLGGPQSFGDVLRSFGRTTP
eukprot:6362587-Prymnesium_polylepis.1